MPRGVPNARPSVTPEVLATEQQPLERIFDDLRVLLEARRQEYHAAAERITEILTSMAPKPRVGRPPKKG